MVVVVHGARARGSSRDSSERDFRWFFAWRSLLANVLNGSRARDWWVSDNNPPESSSRKWRQSPHAEDTRVCPEGGGDNDGDDDDDLEADSHANRRLRARFGHDDLRGLGI